MSKPEVYTPAQFKALQRTRAKVNKYGAKPMTTGGKRYASTKEGTYAQGLELKKLLPASDPDKVYLVRTQVRYSLDVRGVHICDYILDFEVTYRNRVEYVDNKGYKKGVAYRMFLLKKHLMKALYDIDIIEA